jgi:hypothetical protein
VLAELAQGIEEVGMAAARADSEGRGGEDEPAGDEQRPQRDEPRSAPAVTRPPSTTVRAAATATKAPPVASSRPWPGTSREKSASRSASPARAGTNVLTSDPAPQRAVASKRDVLPPHRPIADRQQPAEPTRESVKARPASQSQCGSARPRVSSTPDTRVPRSCGIATAAPSTPNRSTPTARLLRLTLQYRTDPNCPHPVRRQDHASCLRSGASAVGDSMRGRSKRRTRVDGRGRSGRAEGERERGRRLLAAACGRPLQQSQSSSRLSMALLPRAGSRQRCSVRMPPDPVPGTSSPSTVLLAQPIHHSGAKPTPHG